MYPISNSAKALFEAEQRQILRITGTDGNGNAVSITESDVMMGGFNIDRTCVNGNRIEIGTAIASEMTLRLDNRQGQFNGTVFEGAELFVEIGIADWTQSNPTVTYIPCGYFTPEDQPRSMNTITLHALDRMMNFDKEVENLTLPATIANIVSQACTACSVPFTQNLSSLPNYDYSVTELPELQQIITYRNLIQWCAGIMGTNAWIDWTGSLQFSWYGTNSVYTTTTANRFTSDLFEDDITLTGVKYTNIQGFTIVSGTDDYALDMTGNYLAATGIATILPAVKNAVDGFTYRPFSASVINAPYLWPMDMVTFTDKNGNDHSCALTNVNFGINSIMALASKGETAQMNSGISPSGVTPEQGFLLERAKESAISNVDESLTQQDIFNRLTDNGAAQGLYMLNGQLYVNMSYARSGTLILGGLNDVNGVLQVLDAIGNEVVLCNNSGIKITNGELTVPIAYQDTGEVGSFVSINGKSGAQIPGTNLRHTDFRAVYSQSSNVKYETVIDKGVLSLRNGILTSRNTPPATNNLERYYSRYRRSWPRKLGNDRKKFW